MEKGDCPVKINHLAASLALVGYTSVEFTLETMFTTRLKDMQT